jgi:hypothetical protein
MNTLSSPVYTLHYINTQYYKNLIPAWLLLPNFFKSLMFNTDYSTWLVNKHLSPLSLEDRALFFSKHLFLLDSEEIYILIIITVLKIKIIL